MAWFWVVRHAESVGNSAGLFVGRSDYALSDRGVVQAERAAIQIARQAPRLSRVITSPSSRAVETAMTIAGAQSTDVAIEQDDRLREMDYGEWEGRAFASVGDPGAVATAFEDPDFAPPGGESVLELWERTKNALDDYAARVASDDTIVVVTHLGPAKMSAIWGLGCALSSFPKIRIDNASISRIYTRGQNRYIVSINETQHLTVDWT